MITWLKKFFEQLSCWHWWGPPQEFDSEIVVPGDGIQTCVKTRRKCVCCDKVKIRVKHITGFK